MSAATGMLVLLGGPASAKGISYAHFAGPGLPAGGITIIHGDENALWETGLVATKTQVRPTKIALGPAYRASYHMDYAPRATLHQIVYPYAEGGPITFTPKGQHIGQDHESFKGGWYWSSPKLLAFLVANGFPREAPGTERSEAVEVSSAGLAKAPSGSDNGWMWVLGAALVVGLAATLLVARLSVRNRRPD